MEDFMLNLGFLAFSLPAAEGTEGVEGAASGGRNYMLLLLLGFLVLMYLLMYIPERRRRKKLQEQINNLRQGDKVMTTGGLVGEIDFIGEKTVYIKSQDSKFEVVKESVVNVIK